MLGAFILGIGVPIMLFAHSTTACMLLLMGSLLTLAFVSLAFLASTLTSDKAKGIGLSLMTWFYCAIVFDGLVLLFLFAFSDYPLEKAMIVLTALNPIDLGRVMILLQLDISALMGYTGALYQKFFGSGYGLIFSVVLQIFWIIIPLLVALKVFRKKDL
jgi:Cu-processing system permease protein